MNSGMPSCNETFLTFLMVTSAFNYETYIRDKFYLYFNVPVHSALS